MQRWRFIRFPWFRDNGVDDGQSIWSAANTDMQKSASVGDLDWEKIQKLGSLGPSVIIAEVADLRLQKNEHPNSFITKFTDKVLPRTRMDALALLDHTLLHELTHTKPAQTVDSLSADKCYGTCDTFFVIRVGRLPVMMKDRLVTSCWVYAGYQHGRPLPSQ